MKPSGNWRADDYLMHWYGHDYVLKVTARTTDLHVLRLAQAADAYALERGVRLHGTLEFLRLVREALRYPGSGAFELVRAWREGIENMRSGKNAHERQAMYAGDFQVAVNI